MSLARTRAYELRAHNDICVALSPKFAKNLRAMSISGIPVRPLIEQPRPGLPGARRIRLMKYMLIMRASDEAFEAFADYDFEQMLETMGRFNEEMIDAGVLVAAEGLDQDVNDTVVVDYSQTPPVVTDGPYGETKELFGGFWILDVASKEEAVEWAKRAPMAGPGMKSEIRRVASIDEFPQDNVWVQKERTWREATGQL